MFRLCLFVVAAAVTPLVAQETWTLSGVSQGQVFSANVRVHQGKDTQVFDVHPRANRKLSELQPGTVTVHTVHYRLGFPQPTVYARIKNGVALWISEPTVDPRRVEMQAGETLEVRVQRPYEPYDGKFGFLRSAATDVGFILPRPYWFQDTEPGQFKGKEAFPNSIFFLAKEGPEKVFARLAEITVEKIHDEKHTPLGDYRTEMHASCIIALDANGKVPEALRSMDKDQLKKDLQKELVRLYEAWKSEKCYRPFPGEAIAEFKTKGFLPKEFPDGPAIISVSEGLELAKPLLLKWEAAKKK